MLRIRDGDELRICADCGEDFIFSAGERRYFEAHALKRPSRCGACRSAAKWTADGTPHTVGACATADCGRRVAVPFVVKNARPLYCGSCIQRRREAKETPA